MNFHHRDYDILKMISYNSSMEFKTIIEPFKIKSVESLPITTPEERRSFLEREHWNVFGLKVPRSDRRSFN